MIDPANVSYAHGADARPLLGLTIGQMLDEIAARQPNADALIVPYQGVRWSYAQLKAEADNLAAGLIELGLEPGERVGIRARVRGTADD